MKQPDRSPLTKYYFTPSGLFRMKERFWMRKADGNAFYAAAEVEAMLEDYRKALAAILRADEHGLGLRFKDFDDAIDQAQRLLDQLKEQP